MVNFTHNTFCIMVKESERELIHYSTLYVILAVTLYIASFFTVFFNGLFIIISYKRRIELNARDISLIMLAISDIISGLTAMPSVGTRYIFLSKKEVNCIIFEFTTIAGTYTICISVIAIYAININIYLSVVHPYLHEKYVTNARIIIIVLGLWLMLVFPPMITMHHYGLWADVEVTLFCLFWTSALILCFMHAKVVKELKRMSSRSTIIERDRRQMIASSRKALKMAALILGVYVLSFLPVNIINFYIAFFGRSSTLTLAVAPITYSFALFNSLFDPLVYYYRIKSVRKSVKNFIQRLCCNKNNRITPGNWN